MADTTTTTRQGDMWDILSKRLYGTEVLMHVLIKANLSHRKTVIFPAGVVLNVPEVSEAEIQYADNLPPWKTGG